MILRLKSSHLMLLVVPALVLTWRQTAQGADYTLEQIHTAWRNRQERVKSARFEWTETYTIPKGRYGKQGRHVYPPNDTTYDHERRLVLNGGMLRNDWKGLLWNEEKKKFIEQQYFSASDSKTSKSFFKTHADAHSSDFYPFGTIYAEPTNTDLVGGFPGIIILFCVRAFDPQLGLAKLRGIKAPTGLPTLSVEKSVDGMPLAIIEEQFGNWSRHIWVNPSQDFAIVRYVVKNEGHEMDRYEVVQDRDPIAGWIPRSWRKHSWQQAPGNSSLHHVSEATVSRRLINSVVDVKEFRPEFPPGTVVRDIARQKTYLVKDDGTVRDILPGEQRREATYAQIVGTEAGKAALYEVEGPNTIYYWFGGLAAAVVLLCLVSRWRSAAG